MSSTVLEASTCVIRDTASKKGRTLAVSPETAPTRYLHYGRIILDASDLPVTFETGAKETGLICLRGGATVAVSGRSHTLGLHDAIYAPRNASITVTAGANGVDLVEVGAPVEGLHPVQVVRREDVRKDPALHLQAGFDSARRELNVILGKNVSAGRIMAGITFSQPGNWTSWPPHEHAAMLEEAYLYVDMPAPSFGVQLVYVNAREPEVATIVREGDVVLMPAGYHPNVAAPGGTINFVWMMAAHRENVDRQYGVVNVQPEFASLGSGLEKAAGGRR